MALRARLCPILAVLLLGASPALAVEVPHASWPQLAAGQIEVRLQPGGLVIGAPHGGYDLYSEVIARRVAERLGAGYVLASGYRTREHPWNVNRPTMGAGLLPSQEATSSEAQAVFEVYAAAITQQSPWLYAEIHGDARPESAMAIEVASQGLSTEQLVGLKRDLLAAIAAMPAEIPRVGAKVEPLDDLHFRAAAAKAIGVFARVPRALQFELPAALRKNEAAREAYAQAIAQALGGLGQKF